jgi:site-specific recombinase XerD
VPTPKAATLAEQYERCLQYGRVKHLPAEAPRPLLPAHWPQGNLALLERYRAWLIGGGTSELVTNLYHIPMAGHVFGLTLKHHAQLDLDHDLDCALEYVKAKGMSAAWLKNCANSLVQFRRFLRLERGLGEESKVTPFDVPAHTQGLPLWVVTELERYQRVLQKNWRAARIDLNLRGFWSKHGLIWRFLCQERHVQHLADLKRQHILDFIDWHLKENYSASTVNSEAHLLRGFLLFLQDEGYTIPQSLLRIPGLKQPDSLPKYLTDEQVKKLREEIERGVREAQLASQRRLALLMRAAFYLFWQGGLRIGEVEELRLEDLDLPGQRLTVRNGKGLKDRTIYLTETAVGALQDYLVVRGEGTGDHVFLYRNAPLKKDLLRDQLKYAGERVGVKVYPHRLRHTCATQLLNAGCRITSIQAFLGHKKLNTTMIYARAHDQTVAEDYFTAMQRVEQRLDIAPAPKEEPKPACHLSRELRGVCGLSRENEVDNAPQPGQVLVWIERLALPELCQQERLEIAEHLKQVLSLNYVSQLSPPVMALAG